MQLYDEKITHRKYVKICKICEYVKANKKALLAKYVTYVNKGQRMMMLTSKFTFWYGKVSIFYFEVCTKDKCEKKIYSDFFQESPGTNDNLFHLNACIFCFYKNK